MKYIRIAFACLILFGLIYLLIDAKKQTVHVPTQKTTVRIGIALQPTSALMILAWQKDFLDEFGIEPIITTYPSGKRALVDGLLKQKEDFITTQDVPFILNTFKHSNFKIIASLGMADSIQRIIARKDMGIKQASDLKGKKIATQFGSAVHYFLNCFLLYNNLTPKDITLSFAKAENLPNLLISKKIDAFSMREPYIGIAKKQLGEKALILKEKGIYLSYEFLISSTSTLQTPNKIGCHLLKALAKAEHFLKNNPDESLSIIAKTLTADPKAIKKFQESFSPQLTLSQSMLLGMENIARWAIDNKLTDKTEIPNYLNFIHFECLENVDSNKITIIK